MFVKQIGADLDLTVEGTLHKCNRWGQIWVPAACGWSLWSGLPVKGHPAVLMTASQTSGRLVASSHRAGCCACVGACGPAPTCPTMSAVTASSGHPPTHNGNINCQPDKLTGL